MASPSSAASPITATPSPLGAAHLAAAPWVLLSPVIPVSATGGYGGGTGRCQEHSMPGRGLSHPLCLPQPRHALILPRPASVTTARGMSSKSLCAAPLISSQELGLARPARRMLLEGTFAAALPPGAVAVPQPGHRHRAWAVPVPQASRRRGGGRRIGTAGQGGGGALPERWARSWSVSGTDGIVSAGKN